MNNISVEEISKVIGERFPLLNRLFIQTIDSKSQCLESVPLYLGIFLSIMEKSDETPVCIVFPRLGSIGRIASVMFSVQCFLKKYSVLLHEYERTTLKVGENVKLHPQGLIYKYGGFDSQNTDKIWLEHLNGNDRRWFPANECLMRLEKTTAKAPKGKLSSLINSPDKAPFDVLFNTSTFGNHSLIKNEVVILDTITGFKQFADSVALQLEEPIPDVIPVSALLPLGEITRPSNENQKWFKKWDSGSLVGEPILAIANYRSFEILTELCDSFENKTKTIVANDLTILDNLQAFDDVSTKQRLILFAHQGQIDKLKILDDRGCRFWIFNEKELYFLQNSINSFNERSKLKEICSAMPRMNEYNERGLFGSIKKWNSNYIKMRFDEEKCENEKLESICSNLQKIHGNENVLDDLSNRLWRLFGRARMAIAVPSIIDRHVVFAETEIIRQVVQAHSAMISDEIAKNIENILASFEDIFSENTNLGEAKGEALINAINKSIVQNEHVAILSPTENKIDEIHNWIGSKITNSDLVVFASQTIPKNIFFDRIIILSWSKSDRLKRVIGIHATSNYSLVGYPFELNWLKNLEVNIRKQPNVNLLTGYDKLKILYGEEETGIEWPWEKSLTSISPPISTEFNILEFEQKQRAKRIGSAAIQSDAADPVSTHYIRFSGDSYAFLTESHKVPIATDLIFRAGIDNQKLPEKTVLEIKPGDFIVFPESGSHELLKEFADKLIGADSVKLRSLAHRWKDVLLTSGISPEKFHQTAKELGKSRHISTIRNWFAETSQIGTQDKEDLILIAIITEDKSFESEIDDVQMAIDRLRGAHLSAGNRLRDALLKSLSILSGEVEENSAKIELGELGAAWIVQVEHVSDEKELRERNEVNKIHFAESSYSFQFQQEN